MIVEKSLSNLMLSQCISVFLVRHWLAGNSVSIRVTRTFLVNFTQCSDKGLNWKKIALKQKIHGIDRMVMANTGSALKYSNLVEVLIFLAKN